MKAELVYCQEPIFRILIWFRELACTMSLKSWPPPLEVIKIASNNGATALGIENDVGTIEPGKQADIMVLSDNPMDDISNTKKIEAVINNGQFVNGYNCINK